MPRKIEIELTSARPDGAWTWRVSGAKQPKGVLDGALLPPGAKVGDLLRAEAEFELEGTTITSVVAPAAKRTEPERLQLLDTRPFEAVTTSLVPKGARPRRDREDRGPRPDRASGPRPDRTGGPRPDRTGGPRPDRGAAGRPVGERGEVRPRPERSSRPEPGGGRGGERRERPAAAADGDERRQGPGRGPGRPRSEGAEGRRPSGPPKPKRLNPSSVYRNAVLDSLAPEERPVAEQLLQGGIPAVRRAVQEQNARAREEGRPEVHLDALLALAEELLPRLKAAEWRDRADAAAKEGDEINLRDLRSVIAGADAGARDDESRILAKTLRETLDRRETAERDAWVAEITTCIDEGKVTRALRVAGRPPDPRTRFPPELTTRLSQSASDAMAPTTPPERWSALLAAVLESPVRRTVKPVGLPTPPGDALLAAARQAAGRIPALAGLLGLEMPPPPGPRRAGSLPARPPIPPPGRGAGPRPPVAPHAAAAGAVVEARTAEPGRPETVAAEARASVTPETPQAVAAGPEARETVAHDTVAHDTVAHETVTSEPEAPVTVAPEATAVAPETTIDAPATEPEAPGAALDAPAPPEAVATPAAETPAEAATLEPTEAPAEIPTPEPAETPAEAATLAPAEAPAEIPTPEATEAPAEPAPAWAATEPEVALPPADQPPGGPDPTAG
jgi:hypothetical protein